MKKLALLIVIAAVSMLCFAGIDEYYSFNATTTTYTPITGTPIDNLVSDDVLSPPIDIGFTFPYGDATYTQIVVSSNGWIGLGTTLTNSNLSNQLSSETWFPVLAPLWDDTSLNGGTASYLLSGTAPNRILTIQYANLLWNYSGTTTYNLQVQMFETGKVSFIYGSNTGAPNSPSASIGINMSPGGTNWFYSVTPGTPSTVSQTAESAAISTFPANGEAYEFIPVVAAQNDLASTSVTGNTTPSVGTATVYTVSVRNRGSNPQSTYQVKLVTSTGTELGSVNGTLIQPGQVLSFPITWTPTAQGPIILRGKTVLAGDQNPVNDLSNPLSVSVMPAGMAVVTIGDGSEQANMPVNMFWKNSLFETLYFPAEITMVGNISALTFYNNFTTNLPNMPTKIWLGTTQQADLSAGWIPSTQLTLVFDGTVNYPSGANNILIPLQTVYTYTGGNLVMMVNRPMDTQYYNSSDVFLCQTVGTNRTRHIFSDTTLFDPAAPPADAALVGQFPKTSIHLTPLGTDPVAIITPSAVNFGQVLMNSTNTRQVSIMNGGAGTLTVSSVGIAGSPFFTILNPPAMPASLTTGQSVVLNVQYLPTAAGAHSGSITITDNLARSVHTVPLAATCVDPTIYTLPYAQNFDAVTAPALPIDWQKLQQSTSVGASVRTFATGSYSEPNCVYMYNESDNAAGLFLIAPPYTNTIQTNTTKVHFRGKASTQGSTLVVGVMTNPLDAATFTEVQVVALNTAWTEHVVNFAAYTGAGRYVAFKHGLTGLYHTLYVDNVMFAVIPQNDLACTGLIGNTTPSSGNATVYTASIYNWGTATQSAYTVKLFNAANIELASVPGVTVATDQTVQVQLTWTPATEGPDQLYAKVVLAGDQNNLNDNSMVLPITVMPAGLLVVTIGSGTDLGRIPIDMYYQNSLFETMFYPQEIGAFGTITAIAFYNNFITPLQKPTKIWLGTTQQQDLVSGWVPSTQMTLVYDGTVNYPSGPNTIMIPLQTPFTYAGGNLVLMANRPMDTTYYSSQDRFLYTVTGSPRSRNVYSDWTEYDPAAPPADAPMLNAFPNTSLYMTPLGPDPIFTINPASKNFGTVLLNSTHNQTFTVMNAGGSPLTINTIAIAGSPFFSLQNQPTLPAILNTGQTITFVGRYNPTAPGDHTATVTINDHLRASLGSRNTNDSSRTPHTVALSGNCVDPTITALPYLQNFDTVTAPALPVQWTTIIQGTGPAIGTFANDAVSAPNCVAMSNAGDINTTCMLVAPPYATTIATNTTRVNFRAKANGNHSVIVGIMTDPQNPLSFTEVQTVTLSNTWAEYVVTFGAYAGTGRTIAFKHAQSAPWQTIYLDNVMLELIPQNDLAALSITGNTTPTLGIAANYTVSVFNWGSNAQNTYLVKLYKQGDIEIGSGTGTAINPGGVVNISVGWTPDAEGLHTIYGKVILTGDQNSINDQCAPITVTVQPPGLLVYTVGEGNTTGRIPVDMYYRNSLYQCLYYPSEIGNTIGSIYGIGFYNSFTTDLPNMPTNVWIGTTTQTDLSAGWIPSTQLTQVFSGTVNYPIGYNLIHITFPTPFLYLDGQNLVVMVERVMDTDYYSSQDMFLTQTGTQSRARNSYSDSIDFDPANPPDANATPGFPKTSFFIIPGGVGHLNGTVYGAGNQPLPGVAIASTAGGYTATTNAQGQFSIINIIADDYQFTFTHHGYITQTANITIPEDQTISHNINLQQMAMVTVSGTIIGSDTGTGLSGAGLFIQGYEDYTTSTNAAGAFSLPNVYANFTYDYTIICPGYQNHSGTINVGATNYSFGTITLNEVAYAPRLVTGEIIENNTMVSLEWLAPDPTALDVIESFEGPSFPPENWTQVINNTGAPVSGVYPTWCRFGPISINGSTANPTDGMMQSGLWWSYDHQDEWLITPSFNCPPSAYLSFATYAFLGSVNNDHYYVKVSVDNGNNWTILWDASAQTGGWNMYAAPVTIDLGMYEGMQLKIAWQGDDPATNDGLWYTWIIDDIYIGNAIEPITFSRDQLSSISMANSSHIQPIRSPLTALLQPSKAPVPTMPLRSVNFSLSNPTTHNRINPRTLVGYMVWRLLEGQETNPTSWTLLTPSVYNDNSFMDPSWMTLANGNYRWAVKAVYTANVLSVPAFSNVLQKQVITGFISGVVRNAQNNQPIAGATVSAGTHSANTNSVGAYSILIPIGIYNVTATANNYVTQTASSITVSANQSTTVNFLLTPGSDNEDEYLSVTETKLSGNFPNPFNPETTISFAIKDPSFVQLDVYNLKGQKVRSLVSGTLPTGYHRIVWDGKDASGSLVGSGIYYYRMKAGNYINTRKMLLME